MNFSGIQFRLLLLGILPSLLLALSLAFYFVPNHYLNIEKTLKNKGHVTINQLAVSSIYGVFSANTTILNEISKSLLNDPDIVSIHIMDSLGATLLKLEPTPLSTFTKKEIIYFEHPVIPISITQDPDDLNTIPFQLSLPVKIKPIGTVKIALSLKTTHQEQFDYLLKSLFLITTVMFLTILFAIFLSKIISLPIIKLTKTANELAKGRMNARASINSGTPELNTLSESFNSMAKELQQKQNSLNTKVKKATKKLKKRNQALKKSAQRESDQNRAKSRYIAHISHEIRTPMNGVLGFTELLENSVLSSQQREQTLLIQQSANSLLTIINEILDYSSLETGNFQVNISSFNLRDLIENCICTIPLPSNNVQLISDIELDVPSLINSDSTRLRQVITNFLGNAVKFTTSGHIIIRCRLTANNTLFISVSDTGMGIHPDKIKGLFKPSPEISKFGINNEFGAGLGLTICRNIVGRLNGQQGVFSQPKIGSTFWINIPFSISHNEPLNKQHESILVIDSFDLRRNAFIKQLCYLGYQTTELNDIAELKQQNNVVFDLIFYATPSTKDNALSLAKDQLSLLSTATVIFISPQAELPENAKNITLPCRATFLKQTINNINSSAQTIAKKQPALMQRLSNFSIFIADDNNINRQLLSSQFESHCKKLTFADDGKKALSCLQKTKYDLILLDLQMPYLGGEDIIKIIKSPHEINNDTPTVAITAHAQSKQQQALIKIGFDECLIKPILLHDLAEILDLWLPPEPKATYQTIKTSTTINYATALLERVSGNRELAQLVFNDFLEELSNQYEQIKQAVDHKEFSQAKQTTHKLHGSVSFCGFSDLQQRLKPLEEALSNNDLATIYTQLPLLEKNIDSFLAQKEEVIYQLKQENNM